MNNEDISILKLIRSENVGPKTFIELLKVYHSASEALLAIEELSILGGRKKPINIYKNTNQEIEELANIGGRIVTYKSSDYPKLLRHIDDFPPVISVIGKLRQDDYFAVVGSRNASLNAIALSSSVSKEIGESGFNIVSGMAKGIDASAHKSALSTGTTAILAGGLDIIYPIENKKLYEKIKEEGTLISEMPIKTQIIAQYFPRRNRIIAGMASGILVIEAGLKSGSLITANYANEYGRDVFAVPGFPLDPKSKGCNKLIADGAYIFQSAHDVLSHIKNSSFREVSDNYQDYSPRVKIDIDILKDARKKIPQLLSASPTKLEDIINITGYPINVVQIIIIELELAGRVERVYGNKVIMIF